MTTDVINVPRSLLADLLSNDREKRVPAERHLYAILANTTAQPAADGERESCSDCNGLGFGPFGGCGECDGSGQARAAQPQQAVAVTDEVLEHACDARSILRDMIAGIEARGNYSQESTLLFLNQALGSLDYALTAHKTGEEE